jgi:hypothetical protein
MKAVESFYKSKHPDPILCSATFLRPAKMGSVARIDVEEIKKGRAYSTAVAVMSQKVGAVYVLSSLFEFVYSNY